VNARGNVNPLDGVFDLPRQCHQPARFRLAKYLSLPPVAVSHSFHPGNDPFDVDGLTQIFSDILAKPLHTYKTRVHTHAKGDNSSCDYSQLEAGKISSRSIRKSLKLAVATGKQQRRKPVRRFFGHFPGYLPSIF
jgi:hypothetical protein